MYTANFVENLNGKIRNYTKSELPLSLDYAVNKTVYLSLMEIEKKWMTSVPNWA